MDNVKLGQYCREYRKSKKISLKQLGGVENIKNLSAFESGRSSNLRHFMRYGELAKINGELDVFVVGFWQAANS